MVLALFEKLEIRVRYRKNVNVNTTNGCMLETTLTKSLFSFIKYHWVLGIFLAQIQMTKIVVHLKLGTGTDQLTGFPLTQAQTELGRH